MFSIFNINNLNIKIAMLFLASIILTQSRLVTNKTDYERKFGVYNIDLKDGDPSKNLCK